MESDKIEVWVNIFVIIFFLLSCWLSLYVFWGESKSSSNNQRAADKQFIVFFGYACRY